MTIPNMRSLDPGTFGVSPVAHQKKTLVKRHRTPKALSSIEETRCYSSERVFLFFGVAEKNPIGSMYGIFTYMYLKNQPNVAKYAIHGSYGNCGGKGKMATFSRNVLPGSSSI